jgi:hypothetical protein
VGSLGTVFLHKFQGTLFSGTATGENQAAGLHLLLPVEQQDPLVLFAQGHQFSWHFRVKVASHVVGGSMELQVHVCDRKQDLPHSMPRNGAWSCIENSESGDQEY